MSFKIFLIYLTLSFILSKDIPTLNINEEIEFNEDNNEFIFGENTFPSYYIYVKHDYECVRLNVTRTKASYQDPVTIDMVSPGGYHIEYYEVENIKLIFLPKYQKTNKPKKGKIFVNLVSNNIDTSNKIYSYYPIQLSGAPKSIDYLINIKEADTTFQFEYNPKIKTDVFEYNLKNPFKVCDEYNDCDEYITSYNFKKGCSYKISVKFEGKHGANFLPAYAFYSGSKRQNYIDNNNNFFIKLNHFSLIIYLVLFIKF